MSDHAVSDRRFRREFREAKERFGDDAVMHGVSFFDEGGEGRIVFIEDECGAVSLNTYLSDRVHLREVGWGIPNLDNVCVPFGKRDSIVVVEAQDEPLAHKMHDVPIWAQ